MDPKPSRLWEAFHTNKPCYLVPSGRVRSTTRSKHNFLSLLHDIFTHCNPIQTVHAKASETETETPEKAQTAGETTIERLGKTRPAVLVTDDEVRRYLENESGKQRLKELFEISEDHKPSPDLGMTLSSIKFCSVTVFVVTSVFGALAAREKFLKKHQHAKFETKFKAHRAYNDAILIGGAKFGLQWAVKVGAFSSILLLTAQSMAVYRNKTSVWEYIAGGSLTGAILRLNLGLRGFVAGGLIGGVLGAIGGSCIYILMTSANETQEVRHYWQVQQKLQHNKQLEAEFSRPSVPPIPDSALTQPS